MEIHLYKNFADMKLKQLNIHVLKSTIWINYSDVIFLESDTFE